MLSLGGTVSEHGLRAHDLLLGRLCSLSDVPGDGGGHRVGVS